MGGLLRPQSGRVLQIDNGRLLPELDVAWVLQTTNGLANRTVLDNVRLGSLSKSIPRGIRQERTLTAIAAVGLGHRRYARARSLSGGELQRMAIARALTTEAPFLLADEPTGQLDQATTRRILDVLFEYPGDDRDPGCHTRSRGGRAMPPQDPTNEWGAYPLMNLFRRGPKIRHNSWPISSASVRD